MRCRRDGSRSHHRTALTPAAERRQFVGAHDLALAADVAGDLTGPTVLLLHGGGQTRHSWAGAFAALASAGYAVINLDLRGHGESEWSQDGDYSLAVRGLDLSRVAREVDGPLCVIGASMGGSTALYALSAGLKLKTLVLVDIVPRADTEGVARIVAFMSANPDGFDSVNEAAAAVAAYNPGRPPSKSSAGLRRNLRRGEDGRLYWHWDPRLLELGHSSERAAVEDCLESLSSVPPVPTLLIRGAESDVVTEKGIAHLRHYIPHLEVVETAGAGHMVAGDRNDPFNAALMNFLARNFPPFQPVEPTEHRPV